MIDMYLMMARRRPTIGMAYTYNTSYTCAHRARAHSNVSHRARVVHIADMCTSVLMGLTLQYMHARPCIYTKEKHKNCSVLRVENA